MNFKFVTLLTDYVSGFGSGGSHVFRLPVAAVEITMNIG